MEIKMFDQASNASIWSPSSPELLERLAHTMREITEIEKEDRYVAYVNFLNNFLDGNSQLLVTENNPLYDKIFYAAREIREDTDKSISIVLWADRFVRLSDKIPAQNLPTVWAVRNKIENGILFSGVGALEIYTDQGKKIPLILRDAWAPVEPNKYTLPAWRADKLPGITAYEEILEEILLMGMKDGKRVIFVPYIQDGDIYPEKAKNLVLMARNKYILSQIQKWADQNDLLEIYNAELILIPMTVKSWWVSIKTSFGDVSLGPLKIFKEDGFYPLHDEIVNTWEMIRAFSINLLGFTDITVGDGDGFGRDTKLYSLEEMQNLKPDECVSSLNHVRWSWVFSA